MPSTLAILAGAAVATGVYSAVQGNSQARQASHMQAPPPANYDTYDENGNLAGSQRWNATTNTYEYRPAALTPAQKAEQDQRTALRTQTLGNLAIPVDQLMTKYNDYAEKLVSTSYTNATNTASEQMNARGLTGSRAYADRLAEIDKLKADTVLSTTRGLAEADRTQWGNVLNTLDASKNADAATALNAQRTAEAGAAGGSSYLMEDFKNRQAAAFAGANNTMSMSTNLMNTATGLMYLYGYKTGGMGGAPGGTIPTPSYSPVGPYASGYRL